MIQDKIFFDEKDPTGLSYNTPFTFYGSYQGRLWSKSPSGSIQYYTQNSDLSVYATTGSNSFDGNQVITGSLTVTEGITGTATTASYIEYANIDGKPALVSSSAQVLEYNIFATTGSNQFNGNQAITGSLTTTGTIVAQTLNVQQVTSSIVYSSGSNIFGNDLGNTQQFTGSVGVTGSLTVNGALTGTSASFSGLLNLDNSTSLALSINSTTNNPYIRFQQSGATKFFIGERSAVSGDGGTGYDIYAVAGNDLRFFAGASKALTLASTGAATFSSTITASSTGGNGLRVYGASGTNQWDMYLNGANIRFSDNTGGGRFVVDSPATLNTTLFSSTSTYQVSIKSTGAQYLLVGSENASGAGIILDGDSNGDGAGGDYSYIVHESSGILNIVQDSPSGTNEIRFGTAGTENKVVINSSGNIGIAENTWINASSINLIRSSVFGYSSSYKTTQLGALGSTRAISLGVDLTGNPSGNFSGNEIVLPNDKGIIAPNAANNDYIGVLRVTSSNGLNIGGNYTVDGWINILSNGNVGIGTPTPVTKLSLGGYNGARLPYINGTGATFDASGITVTSANSGNAAIGGGLDLTNNTYSVNSYSPIISFSSRSSSGDYNNSYAGIWGQLGGPGGDANWNAGALVFGTAGSYGINERMRINSVGNVGIGTDTPTAGKLVVNGNISITGNNYLDFNNGDSRIVNTSGQLSFQTYTVGDFNTRMTITGIGYVYLGNGFSATNHRINLAVNQGGNILVVSGYAASPPGSNNDTAIFYGAGGASPNGAATALGVMTNSSTGRSINAGGTINASGADYAEYMTKAVEDNIAKGDIVGIDSNAKVTNIFANAISFAVKSTDPSYVGGDVWGNAVGKRPIRTTDQTEEEFAPILAEFEAELEIARAKVDRISFSGQVPCNVMGASVGDYIIPVEIENGKIGGQAISNPTFEQYQIAVGKVWKIMEDGRAWIAVKIG